MVLRNERSLLVARFSYPVLFTYLAPMQYRFSKHPWKTLFLVYKILAMLFAKIPVWTLLYALR
jgi:hypothetical protein